MTSQRDFLNSENPNVGESVTTNMCLKVGPLVADLLFAASFAPGAVWWRRDRRQELWDVTMETDSLLRIWWRRRPRSDSDTGRPSIWEMWTALEVARLFRSLCKSWETSPYCLATRQRRSPKLWRRCCRGPTWLSAVPQYFLSMCWALSRYSLGSPLARWSTDFREAKISTDSFGINSLIGMSKTNIILNCWLGKDRCLSPAPL